VKDALHPPFPYFGGKWRAEGERSCAAERIIRARVRAVVLALLPLHDAWPDEEPTDLIEWAEALAP
jgi:hypothetical protein